MYRTGAAVIFQCAVLHIGHPAVAYQLPLTSTGFDIADAGRGPLPGSWFPYWFPLPAVLPVETVFSSLISELSRGITGLVVIQRLGFSVDGHPYNYCPGLKLTEWYYIVTKLHILLIHCSSQTQANIRNCAEVYLFFY